MKRRILLLAVVVASLVLPASALAAQPANDEIPGATPISFNYTTSTSPNPPVMVAPGPGIGGWEDATPAANATSTDPQPSCATVQGYHTMWYSLTVGEPSVGSLSLSTTVNDPGQYQPIVAIYNKSDMSPVACGLGGSDLVTKSTAVASAYLATGSYYVEIASASFAASGDSTQSAPTVVLTTTLRDVTPPQVSVAIPRKILGVGDTWTFNGDASTDSGSMLDPGTATWSFYPGNTTVPIVKYGSKADPLRESYAWKTAGLHRVSLSLRDFSGNSSTYDFFVYVHTFAVPKVAVEVFPPLPGAGSIHLVLSHDVPVNVRLVIFQGGRLLRAIPRKLIKGSHAKTSLVLGLLRKVSKKGGYITVSGTASSLGQFPNTVPLLTCSVDPVHGGGHCA